MDRIYRISRYDGEEHEPIEIMLVDASQWEVIRQFLSQTDYKQVLHTISEMKENGRITSELCFDKEGNTDLNKMEPVVRKLVEKFRKERR